MVVPSEILFIPKIYTYNSRMILLFLPVQVCIPYLFTWNTVTNNIHTEQILVLFSKIFLQTGYLAGCTRKQYISLSIKI